MLTLLVDRLRRLLGDYRPHLPVFVSLPNSATYRLTAASIQKSVIRDTGEECLLIDLSADDYVPHPADAGKHPLTNIPQA